MVYLVNTVVDFEITCENRLENEMRRRWGGITHLKHWEIPSDRDFPLREFPFLVSSPLTRARKTLTPLKPLKTQ